MVCALGSGRMAALARLLTSGSVSHSIADDFGHKKLAAQYVHREFHEANEANLIDEEDMHVFDLRPMTDPLHLVRCNACKRPIKASQYAIHAEICTSLTCLEEISLELDGNTGQKKPPRKERRNLLTVHSNQAASIVEQDKFEHLDGGDISAPESHLEAPFAESENAVLILDGSGISPGNTNCSGTAIPCSRKRSKPADGLPMILDHFEAASGVISQEALSCRKYPRRSIPVGEKTSDNAIGHQMTRKLNESVMLNKDAPVPLATKVYYSQRSNRLRSSISHLYYNATTRECPGEFGYEKVLQPTVVRTLTSSPSSFSLDQIIDDHQDRGVEHPLYSLHKSDQILPQSSELYSCRPGSLPPATNISNQFPVNNVLRPRTSLGKMSSTNFSNSYSFADSSGKPLGSLQQPEGSAPVV